MNRKTLYLLLIAAALAYVLWRLAQGPARCDPGLPANPEDAQREADAFWRDVEGYINGGA